MIKKSRYTWVALILAAVIVLAVSIYFLKPGWWHHGLMGAAHMTGMEDEIHRITRAGNTEDNRARVRRMMGELVPAGITPDRLPERNSPGARGMERYCAQCHNLPGPGMYTAPEWPAVLARMQARMGMHMQMMGGIVVPAGQEWRQISNYLQKHAIKKLDPARFSDIETPAGQAFSNTCAQCHVLPDPAQHSAAEWPTVVIRMRENMRRMGRPVYTDDTQEIVTGFLQQHAEDR